MLAWETLDEPLEEQDEVESNGDLEIQFKTDEIYEEEQKVQHEDINNPPFKDSDVNIQYSESSSSTDYDYLEQERLQRPHSFAWNPLQDFRRWDEKSKEQEGRAQKESLAIPETSCEAPLEDSDIVDIKNMFTLNTEFNTEKDECPNQKLDEKFGMGQKRNFHKLLEEKSDTECQGIKHLTIWEIPLTIQERTGKEHLE